MPKIKTNNGVVNYKTVPIYLGVKQINKQVAAENLSILKDLLDDNGIDFILYAGTILGAVRDHDFITHDEDIDLAFDAKDKDKVFDLLHLLKDNGFEVARYDRRGLLSVIRNGEYIDFYFFSPYTDDVSICSGAMCMTKFIEKKTSIQFKGRAYLVPEDYEGYLLFEYGKDWRTPIKWNNYEMPIWKKNLYSIKEYVKGILPDFLFNILVKGPERKLTEHYWKIVERYKKIQNEEGYNVRNV